jgi:hypothetical protein
MARDKKFQIEIPADLSAGYDVPEGATVADLQAIEQAAQEQALALLADDSPTDEQLEQATWLQGVMAAAAGARESAEQAEAERAQRINELRSSFKPAEAPDEEGGDEPAEDGGEGGEGEPTGEAEDTAAETPEPALTAAAAVSVKQVKNARSRIAETPRPVARGSVAITAAADVPGFAAGGELSAEELGKAFQERAKGFRGSRGNHSVQVAHLKLVPSDGALLASARGTGPVDISDALKHALDQKRLRTNRGGGSLLAAGGWCAPSEIDYDVPTTIGTDDLISLPEVLVNRGGIRYFMPAEFSAIYEQGVFQQTEAQNIAGATKSMYSIPCPSAVETRLGADGAYYTGGILSDSGFPEGSAAFLSDARAAYEHHLSAKTIAAQVAGSTALAAPNADLGVLYQLLGSIDLTRADMVHRGRVGKSETIEIVLPDFVLGMLRTDLAGREGRGLDDLGATDAQLEALFTARNVSVQFVVDWQDNATGVTTPGFGKLAGVTAWPTTFSYLAYAAGTWQRVRNQIINLSAVYDSTLLETNEFVQAFFENEFAVLKRRNDSRVVTLSTVSITGLTSGGIVPAAA